MRNPTIEHVVAVSEAHDSGLCAADAETRRRFAGDLDNLTLAVPHLNRYEKVAQTTLPTGFQSTIGAGLQDACWQ